MNSDQPTSPEPVSLTRRPIVPTVGRTPDDIDPAAPLTPLQALRARIFLRTVVILTALAVILAITAFFGGRHWTRQAMRDALPQLDGNLPIAGLTSPVTVQRDAHGVPHIRAASLDDLLVAQGFITAQDRLWQMDTLRRHAAGDLAEILGPSLIPHDRAQRTLQIRAAADRAIATLPPDQLRQLELYARGVNASIEAQRPHLPLEFRILRYQPASWTPRDSVLVGLAMFQDLTNAFPQKLNREALTAKLPPDLIPDLYPVGSWRDHPPTQPAIDLTVPQENIPDIPLDESQSKLHTPTNPGAPHLDSEMWASRASATALTKPRQQSPGAPSFAASSRRVGSTNTNTASTNDLLTAQQTLAPILTCEGCTSGSNNWAVAGTHTATGKPLLSNDMHLAHNVPGIWYETDLQTPTLTGDFHVTGLSLPGVPFIIVGHNAHLAWGFTNLGADVQDIYIEHTRGTGANVEYESPDQTWHPILHQTEIIHVHNSKDVALDVPATQHGTAITPIISGIFPTEHRTLSLRWTIYDPANITPSFYAIDAATDWPSLHAAFSTFGGPAQNLVYADDQGHIGYHAVGKIPVRGSLAQPAPLNPVPANALDPAHDWAGYIPFDQLPQAFDPPGGILATANARITPDDYPFPITLNWGAPYRNERIWQVLAAKAVSTKDHLTPADMLALQTDIYSDVDHVIAQRLAYAIDHSTTKDMRLRKAADILRNWNGNVDANAAAPAIVDAARTALWPILLDPLLGPHPGDTAALYSWFEKPYAEEQLIMHTPARWLPARYANWNELLTATVSRGLLEDHSTFDLNRWQYGKAHPIEIEHPIYSQSPLLQRIIGLPTGTGIQPQSGDATTVKQVGRSFGPSERFTADLANLDNSTLNLVLGQSANPTSPWFMDQWPAWYHGATYPLPFTNPAVDATTTHTLTLTPQ